MPITFLRCPSLLPVLAVGSNPVKSTFIDIDLRCVRTKTASRIRTPYRWNTTSPNLFMRVCVSMSMCVYNNCYPFNIWSRLKKIDRIIFSINSCNLKAKQSPAGKQRLFLDSVLASSPLIGRHAPTNKKTPSYHLIVAHWELFSYFSVLLHKA